jgi:prepilin-type N-terminal cleavage/methylation domain-containing protein
MRRRAFTLIELLTVMAISAILLGLIVLPLFQSFSLTRTAQAFSEAQDRARLVTEQIAREVGNSARVRGAGGGVETTVNGITQTLPVSTLVIRVPAGAGGNWPSTSTQSVEVALPYTKLDFWLPAEGEPVRGVNGGFVDPVTGKEDPTLLAPKGQVNLPAGAGAVMVRYFIGLRDPFRRYQNPYDGLLMQKSGEADNLYVLYRAQVVPYVYRRNRDDDPGSEAYRPNLAYFESDPETDSRIIDFDDPRFLLPELDGSGNPIALDTNARANRIRNWLRRATILTNVNRYDMIAPVFDQNTRRVQPVAGSATVPQIVPLIQFRPARINSDPAEPQLAVRSGEESDDSAAVGPDVYLTQYGLWGSATIRVYPRGWTYLDAGSNDYLVAHRSVTDSAKPMSLYAYDPDAAAGGVDFLNPPTRELFDLSVYDRLSALKGRYVTTPIYPFTQAIAAANVNSGWLSATNTNFRQLFTPFKFNRDKGRITTSFGIDEVGDVTATPTVANNLPVRAIGPALTPDTDTALAGDFHDAAFNSINRLYNKIYLDFPSLRAGNVHRFVDLRVVPNSDGTPSPLFPNVIAGQATGFQIPTSDGGARSKVTIVPGSDVVYGPDQLPGPNYGATVRYTRVATGDPGPNQYRLNYADVAEPTNSAGAVDYGILYPDIPAGELSSFNPRTYDPTNVVSAVLQPRFKAGYLQLYSGPDIPLPTGVIRVFYKFSFTGTNTGSARARSTTTGAVRADVRPTETFTVDYDTRQLLDVLLTVSTYPQSNVPNPQTVTLKSTATVRNFTR